MTSVSSSVTSSAPSATPRVLVFASDIGAALNQNPYCTPKEVAQKIAQSLFPAADLGVAPHADSKVQNVKRLARDAPADILTLADTMGLKGEADALRGAQRRGVAATALADTPEASALAHAVVSKLSAAGRSSTTVETLAAAERVVEGELRACSAKVKTEVLAAVKTSTYTSRGIRDEASGLTLFGEAAKVKVAPGSGSFLSRLVFKGLAVGGKEDGRVLGDDNQPDAVVEIKRRQHKFFGAIPPRELSQLYVYMFVHNVKTGYWVQLLDNVVRYEEVTWDAAHWEGIVKGLRQFREALEPYLTDSRVELLSRANDDLGMAT